MRLRKNVNMASVVERLKELQNFTGTLTGHFTKVINVLDDSTLGITELNYNLDEDLARWRNSVNKIEDLIRSL